MLGLQLESFLQKGKSASKRGINIFCLEELSNIPFCSHGVVATAADCYAEWFGSS